MTLARSPVWVALLFVGNLAASCAHGDGATTGFDPRPAEYRIGKEDVLEVTVWKDAALSKTLPVRSDGKISMPLIGELVAAGKTPNELSDEIQKKLAPFVKEPSVHVIVREFNSARFFIVGEVARPGMYTLHGTVTPLEAIAMAGGLTEFARKGGITVIRRSGAGEQRLRVDFDDLVKGKARVHTLAPGDTIYVP
jgi:polysaccharide export outer membrane protein